MPRAAASRRLLSVLGMSSLVSPEVSGVPVSGSISLAIMMVPGAVMMTAARRCFASTPKAMYASMMLPEMWAIPAVITVISSERVILSRKGRMVSGASVCPMKIDAATSRLSAPLAPIVLLITTAIPRTSTCMMPR